MSRGTWSGWASRRRGFSAGGGGWCRSGTVAALCLVRATGVERREQDVLVVSIDQLIPALRRAMLPVSRRAA